MTQRNNKQAMTQHDALHKKIIALGYSSTTHHIEKKLVCQLFSLVVSHGTLHIDFGNNDIRVIDKGPHPIYPGKTFGIRPPRLLTLLWILLAPEYRLPQSYVQGKWSASNCELVDLLLFFRSQESTVIRTWHTFVEKTLSFFFIRKQYITSRHSTREARYNYDLPPAFYKQFLGKYMIYSCAFFDQNHKTLNQAQEHKMHITCERLQLTPGLHVLDIGCGWGELATYIAKHYDCQVTGISIARNQIRHAQEATARLNKTLQQRLKFEHIDYDEFNGSFDRIVSVGMAEHIGKKRYANYFNTVNKLLKPDGIAVIHSIVTHRNKARPNKWIDKYIFPGGYIPQISELIKGAELSTGLLLEKVHMHHGVQYATTLRHWTTHFMKNVGVVEPIIKGLVQNIEHEDVDKTSLEKSTIEQIRKWIFYLHGVQTMFLSPDQKPCDVAQLVFIKRTVPVI